MREAGCGPPWKSRASDHRPIFAMELASDVKAGTPMSELFSPRTRSVVRLVTALFVIVAATALLYSQAKAADKVPAAGDQGTPLHRAAQTGDLVSLQSQLKRGAD